MEVAARPGSGGARRGMELTGGTHMSGSGERMQLTWKMQTRKGNTFLRG
jgi:hypothetical protein